MSRKQYWHLYIFRNRIEWIGKGTNSPLVECLLIWFWKQFSWCVSFAAICEWVNFGHHYQPWYFFSETHLSDNQWFSYLNGVVNNANNDAPIHLSSIENCILSLLPNNGNDLPHPQQDLPCSYCVVAREPIYKNWRTLIQKNLRFHHDFVWRFYFTALINSLMQFSLFPFLYFLHVRKLVLRAQNCRLHYVRSLWKSTIKMALTNQCW